MDFKMNAQSITITSHPVWDCNVQDGIVPVITDADEDMQSAILATFMHKGSIPQLEDIGVPWSDFLTGEKTFGEIDSIIRENLINAGLENYYPQYEYQNDKLTMTIGKEND